MDKFHADGPPTEFGASKGADYYPHVGLAINRFEYLDGVLAQIFAELMESRSTIVPRRVFGEIISSSTRHDLFRIAAATFFEIHEMPDLKKRIKDLEGDLNLVRGFRNRLVHGVVYQYGHPDLGFWILPAAYSTRRIDSTGAPKFHIGISHIEVFTTYVLKVTNEAADIRRDLLHALIKLRTKTAQQPDG